MDDLKTWLSEPLRCGYMEVAIVGDIDPDAAIAAVAKTLRCASDTGRREARLCQRATDSIPEWPKDQRVPVCGGNSAGPQPCLLADRWGKKRRPRSADRHFGPRAL